MIPRPRKLRHQRKCLHRQIAYLEDEARGNVRLVPDYTPWIRVQTTSKMLRLCVTGQSPMS